MTTYTDIPAVQIGTRIRLNEDQRSQLRAAYAAATATHSAPVDGKGISVATATRSSLDTELCMDKITFSSLIASRESIALPLILRFQRVLGVKIIDEKELKAAFNGYVAYLKESHGF
jgi:hypothetical protein